MKEKIKPTESEMAVLQILWQRGPSSVREVNDEFNKEREVGYTTTLKIMQIMAEKNYVSRDTESRTHIYTSKLKETEVRKDLIDRMVDGAFRGSAMQLVMQALGNHKTSKEELEDLKTLIEKIEKEQSK